MVGQLASCNALEPIVETGDNIIRASELIQESVTLSTGGDLSPQETMSESPTVMVT